MPDERRFIGEPIQPEFNGQPLLTKQPGCPVRFHWRNAVFPIAEMLAEWHEYPKGKFAGRPSRGRGRDYYRVRTADGRVFVLYYDRAPKNLDDSLGEWILLEEENPKSAGDPQDGTTANG